MAGGGIDFHDADDLFYPNSQLNFDAPPIVSAARRRFKGEKVPHEEKVFSLFEPHTELIKKGKKDKPMEFGHLIFLTQTREKFITDCILHEKSPSETTMLPEVVERHEDQFGRKPLDAPIACNTYSFPLLLSTSLKLFSTNELHTISTAEAPTKNEGEWHFRTLFFVIQRAHFSIFPKNHVRR